MKNKVLCGIMLLSLLGMGVWLILKTPEAYSNSERRLLAQKSVFTVENFLSGTYGKKVEAYGLDQFPLREELRSVKAVAERDLFGKKDSNGIYFIDGFISKMEYPLQEQRVAGSCRQLNAIYEKYLQGTKVRSYLVMIPDKNRYLAKENGMLAMDYEVLYQQIREELGWSKEIVVEDLLEKGDYYRTDSHWRQENIVDVAERIGAKMGTTLQENYQTVTLETPFYGVYAGQSAYPVAPDSLCYLTNEVLKSCTVTCYDTGKAVEKSLYNEEKARGRDPYEMFLNGTSALLTIENPKASTEKELILFRDSFGSSLAPLLVEGYQKITLIDLRYIQSDLIGKYVTFSNQDVLFCYSTLMLNHSLGKAGE